MPDRAPQEHPGEEPAADPGNHPGGRRGRGDADRDSHSVGDAKADSGVDGVDIPLPRPPLDDLPVISPSATDDPSSGLPENGLVEPVWRYDQHRARGKRRRYNGYVDRIGGVEGQRLRESLAAAIRDLLDWAAQHADNVGNADSDGESRTDSSRDGGSE